MDKMEILALTDSQKFEIERFSRVIDATDDVTALKATANQLLRAWMAQKAATVWAMKQTMPTPLSRHD
jgi:hypothetical protein